MAASPRFITYSRVVTKVEFAVVVIVECRKCHRMLVDGVVEAATQQHLDLLLASSSMPIAYLNHYSALAIKAILPFGIISVDLSSRDCSVFIMITCHLQLVIRQLLGVFDLSWAVGCRWGHRLPELEQSAHPRYSEPPMAKDLVAAGLGGAPVNSMAVTN